jgi:hypothetical protein
VSGLIRWSIEAAKKQIEENKNRQNNNDEYNKSNVNARFIIFDPNGEYGDCFKGLGNIKRYEVKVNKKNNDNQQKSEEKERNNKTDVNKDVKNDNDSKQLIVPSWMWNSWEWASITQASAKTQIPTIKNI